MFGSRLVLAPRSLLSCHPERSEGSAFRLSTLHALSVSAFNSSDVCPFSFKLSSACPERSRRVNFPPLTPFPATLTSHLQLAENKTTLSLAVATLTSRVKHKSFACHSYKKHPGRGYIFQAKSLSCSAFDAVSFGFGTYEKILGPRFYRSGRFAWDSQSWLSSSGFHRSRITGHGPRVANNELPLTASAPFLSPVTSHQSQNH